jgi:hypothetical protein
LNQGFWRPQRSFSQRISSERSSHHHWKNDSGYEAYRENFFLKTTDLSIRSTNSHKTLGILRVPHGHPVAMIWSTKTC